MNVRLVLLMPFGVVVVFLCACLISLVVCGVVNIFGFFSLKKNCCGCFSWLFSFIFFFVFGSMILDSSKEKQGD